jgi:hypothetical protein
MYCQSPFLFFGAQAAIFFLITFSFLWICDLKYYEPIVNQFLNKLA